MQSNLTIPTQNHYNAVITALCMMNIIELHHLLRDDCNYNNIPKKMFLQLLQKVFETLSKDGCTRLMQYPSICAGCEAGAKVVLLVAEPTKKYLALVVERNSNNEVYDIYSCNRFTVKHFPRYKSYTQICFDTSTLEFYENKRVEEMPKGDTK